MPIEALKVQAMAARTYTLRNMGRYRAAASTCWVRLRSSEYRGVDREHPNSTAAVDATRGLVLMYGSQLADTVYSAEHGGHSAAARDVWGGEHAYLRLASTVEKADPNFRYCRRPCTVGSRASPKRMPAPWFSGCAARFGGCSPCRRRACKRSSTPARTSGASWRLSPEGRAVSGHVTTVEFVGTKERPGVGRQHSQHLGRN